MKLSAAAAGGLKARGDRIVAVGGVGREKFRNGEADFSEGIAGILGVAGAFLCGHAEIICGNKHLYISFKLND